MPLRLKCVCVCVLVDSRCWKRLIIIIIIITDGLYGVVWRFGVAVTALGVSTKLLYIEPVSTGMADRLGADKPPR